MRHLCISRKQANSVIVLACFIAFASSALAQQDPSSSTFGDTGQSDTISAPITTVTPSALPHITLPKNYTTVRGVHATFVCLAWLLFFPLGSVLIRVLDSPNVVWIHATVQGTGYLLFMIGAGCGIWMARTDGVIGRYHPIIGISLLVALSVQPVTELLNHFLYQKHPKIIVAAHVHIWFGRFLMIVGTIQGGLGFMFSASFPGAKPEAWPRILYGVIAIVVWIMYVVGTVLWPIRYTLPWYAARKRRTIGTEEMQELTR